MTSKDTSHEHHEHEHQHHEHQHEHHEHEHEHHEHEHEHSNEEERWKHEGVRVIKGNQLDDRTAQTPGMYRQAAINAARVGAQKIWAGTVTIAAKAKTGAHHHGPLESVIYIVKGKARLRWGEQLEYVAEADPGDFICKLVHIYGLL